MPWANIQLPPPVTKIAKWKLEFNSPEFPSTEESAMLFPVVKPDWKAMTAMTKAMTRTADNDLVLMWHGHATCY